MQEGELLCPSLDIPSKADKLQICCISMSPATTVFPVYEFHTINVHCAVCHVLDLNMANVGKIASSLTLKQMATRL